MDTVPDSTRGRDGDWWGLPKWGCGVDLQPPGKNIESFHCGWCAVRPRVRSPVDVGIIGYLSYLS